MDLIELLKKPGGRRLEFKSVGLWVYLRKVQKLS